MELVVYVDGGLIEVCAPSLLLDSNVLPFLCNEPGNGFITTQYGMVWHATRTRRTLSFSDEHTFLLHCCCGAHLSTQPQHDADTIMLKIQNVNMLC